MSNIELAKSFLKNFEALKEGDSSALERIMKLWTRDATFQFEGMPELEGKFQGTMALEVLFSSVSHRAKSGSGARGVHKLRVNEVNSGKIRTVKDACYCDWTQVISDKEGQGALINGIIKLTFREGSIASAQLVAVPMMTATDDMLPEGLSMKELKIDDIGRLALAAWAVV